LSPSQPSPGHFGRLIASRLLLAAALAAAAPASSSAQEAPADQTRPEKPADQAQQERPADAVAQPPSDVEVIRILGRGVSDIQTDVPASVTQFDAAALEALGAQNVSDLAKVTPNVEIRVAGATAATFFIRGVGLSDFSANAAGAVAIYQDDVPLNAPAIQLGQLYDVENVEVLRGPQGTGDFRNASAGAIKAYSRKPTGEYQAQMRSSFSRYQSPDAENAFVQDYEGAIEAPLAREMLATRLAFRFLSGDPYITNGCGDNRPCGATSLTGGLPGLPDLVGDKGSWAARGQLRFLPPGTEMDWLLNVHGARLDQQSTLGQAIGTGFGGTGYGTFAAGSPQYIEPDQFAEKQGLCLASGGIGLTNRGVCRPASLDPQVQAVFEKRLAEKRPLDRRPYRGDYDKVGQTVLDSWGTFLRGDVPLGSLPVLGPVHLKTISGYETYQRDRLTDQDFTSQVLFEATQNDQAWEFSQSLAFSGELPESPLRWETGGAYLMEKLDPAHTTQDLGGDLSSFKRDYTQDLSSYIIWSSFSWDFLDEFTLEGGVRWNSETKRFDFTETRQLGSNPPFFGVDCCLKDETTWNAPTGTLSLIYHVNEEVNAYWKYSRGFKAGHYNANRGGNVDPADPETIDSFEVGTRGRFLDSRLDLGGALFYYKYSGYQVFVFEDNADGRPPTLEVINANDAEVYGAEVDLRAEPLAGWVPDLWSGLVLSLRFGWLASQFLDFTNEVVRFDQSGIPTTFIIDYSGNQLVNSPTFKLSGALEWTFDLGRWGALIPRYDFAWTDDVFFDPSEGRGSLDSRGNATLPEYATGQPAYWLHNLRLAYRTPAGNTELAIWARNILDQRYKTYAFDASVFSRLVINFVGEPRTVGLDLSIQF
jgi:iron complex outermembrane receptor protein